MTDSKETNNTPTEAPEAAATQNQEAPRASADGRGNRSARAPRGRGRGRAGGDRPQGGRGRGRGRGDRRPERSEFDQKIISIRRVTRVVAGGRRFSFSVTMVAGDRKGRVGVGIGKAGDTALAIEKAMRDAKKHMVKVRTTENHSIPFDARAKYGASVVELRPAPGRGLVVGGAPRTVLELAGVKDVSAKILSRSKNGLNNARATILALKQVGTVRAQAARE